MIRYILLCVAVVSAACATTAADPELWTDPILATAEEPAEDDADEEEPEQSANVMLGGALRRGDGGALTIGLDYERMFEKWLGVGVYVDLAFGRRFAFVGGPGFFFHPTKRLVLLVGPGFEYDRSEMHLMCRLGGFYEFDVGEYFISPALYVDVIQHHKPDLVFGVNFGKKW